MDELYRQWQAFASALPGARPASAASSSFGFAPFIDAAERFAAATRSFRDAVSGASAPAAQAAAETFGNFLRDQFADFFKVPWGGIPDSMAPGASAPGELPALGLTREHQQRAQRATEAWRDMDEAQRRLQRLWSDTLREAASAYVARVGAPQTTGLTPDALNKLYDSWIDCAEEAYARTAHSEAFCDALADYVNAGSRWRRESNAGAELWAKLLDLPTRNEVNSLAQRLRALEEQVRSQAVANRDTVPKPRRKPKAQP
jgi:polyhydroxyalkanoate synthase subunit PhaE